ncbi:hypothetical protein [Hydrogenimonas thermophila]|uniref:Uncharacterized protein n=1 Tax=Hydrogenimonas thermophila TaxID=223786 RepID=A0A1I5MUP0_9BACT|nr:hypothetical protein [Hydrogenimonas thermophila]SFP13239.1 hypothetical protein SAMN05216234_10729 [Hydrogenimonas thermophila]
MFFSKKSISKSEQTDLNKIVSIDPYNSIYYQLQNNTLNKVKKLEFNKKNHVVSTLNTKDFISTVIELSINIPNEDLKDAIELKTYEDLGLDQTLAYVIRFEEILDRNSENKRFFNVFVTEPNTIEETFQSIKEQVKFIDAIYPKPYLIQNLYEKNILSPFGIHGFLYFQREDAFVALFKDGKYLYSKSIKFSFETIYEHFCELYGERVDEDTFFEIIRKDGINSSNLDYQSHLKKLFTEIFLHINDIFLYTKRAFEIDSIDLFFVGSYFGKIEGIDEYITTYLGINSSNFDFDYGIENIGNEYIDQFHYLSCIEAQKTLQGTSTAPNFTLFFRPPPFVMRRSGKFIITLSAATLIVLSLPVYNYIYDSFIKIDIKLLQNETNKITKLSNAIRSEIKSKENIKKSIESKIELEKNLLEKKRKILQAVYDKKVNYLMKAKTIVQLGNDMSKFNVYVTKITNKDNQFILSLYASNEKNITNFIKYLTNHYNQIVYTDIEKIYKDKNGIYRGDLKVKML